MNHTTKAMLDLLFTLRETKEKCDEINNQLYRLNPSDDFGPHVSAAAGKIEARISDALDLYFEEVTGCESLATHMLYETGRVQVECGEWFDLKERSQFEAFLKREEKKGV